MIGPAILLAHGARGDRAAARACALAQPSDLVVVTRIDGLESCARSLAERVPGQSRIDVIHLVDPHDVPSEQVVGAATLVTDTARALPALHFQQWVVAMVGEEWEDDELGLLDTAGPGRPASGLLVASRSSEAKGLLGEDDEVAMASDLAYALMSTDLRRTFEQSPHWTAGASTVMYRRRLLVAALGALHAGRYLDESLLAPSPAVQPYGAAGRQWPEQEGLTSDRHHELLSRGALGGSAYSDLAVSSAVFEDTPLEILSDALRSYFEQLAVGMLGRVEKQIDRNEEEHRAEVAEALERRAADVLRESLCLESVREFLDNVDAGLAEQVHATQVAVVTAEQSLPEGHEVLLRELERAIRKLPYPAAIAVRSVGFAVLGVIAYLLVQRPLDLPPEDTPVGAGVGAVLALLLYAWYRWCVRRIQRLRRKYLRAIELRLRAEAELHLLRRVVTELTALREHAAAVGTRLAALRGQLAELRSTYADRVADRTWGQLAATPYSVFVPAASDVSTESLGRQFPLPPHHDLPAAILRAVLPDAAIGPIDLGAADEIIVDHVAAQLEHAMWPSLDALLGDAPATREKAVQVLATPVSPILRRSDFNPQGDEVRRFLFLDLGRAERAASVLGAGIDVDGERHSDDADTMSVLALRSASLVRPDNGGADARP